MTATLEREIGELRSDVRHVQAALERSEARHDRVMVKLDELLDRLGEHIGDDTRLFAAVDQKIEVAAAEKRGEGRAAAVIRWTVTAAIAALAGLGGSNVRLPGLH